jgi:lycopene cyclase domain-containing protein
MEYLIILLILLIITVGLEWKFHIHLYQSRRERLIIPLFFFSLGTIWDSFAVAKGHWYFGQLSGITIGLLPLEEYLFFLIIPYSILTFYRFLKKEV